MPMLNDWNIHGGSVGSGGVRRQVH